MAVDANAFTTLDHVHDYLGLSAADGMDMLLEDLINRTSAEARDYLGYDPTPQDYAEYHDGRGQDVVILNRRPILRVYALSDDGDSVGTEGDDFHVEADEGMVTLDSGVFSSGRRHVYCLYEAGLSPWPYAALEQPMLAWVQHEYAGRGTGDSDNDDRTVKSEQIGRYKVEYEDSGNSTQQQTGGLHIPKDTRAALDRYRRMGEGFFG